MNEVMHFTKTDEIKHFAEVKVSSNDNAYGVTWAEVVRNYLKKSYAGEEAQAEVEAFGKTYKVLRRTDVTAFYDTDGNTLFDVTNERLADEYDWFMSNPLDEAGEDQEDEADEDVAIPMGTASLKDIATGNIPAPTEEEVVAAIEENSKSFLEKAKEKLEAELKKAKDKTFAEPVIEYLLGRCEESESLAQDICQEHKTWEKCYKYLYEQAKKSAEKGSSQCAVRDEVVFEWSEDYYRKDDKAEEEKKAKAEAERKQKAKEQTEKSKSDKKEKARADYDTTLKSGMDNHKLSEKEIAEVKKASQPQPKKSNKDMEGQMDLFSLMGM